MEKLITVPLPVNMGNRERALFEPYTSYKIPSFRVRQLTNVFVTSSGLALNRSGLIRASHHDYPEESAVCFQDVSWHFREAEKDPASLLELEDEKIYLLIHHRWTNYYHWLCEAILRLWLVKDKLHSLVLLLPESYRQIDYVRGSLEPFGIKLVFYIPEGKSILAGRLCLPPLKPLCDSYDGARLLAIRRFYLDYLRGDRVREIDLGERLYLSRRKAARKKVLNEQEVEEVMRRHGFTVVCNEDYSFLEQLRIYSHARYLVSIHGSGLTNMLFMREGSCVLEILKAKTNRLDRPSFVFWYQAAALGFRYYQQINPPVDADGDDYFFGDFRIDIPLLEQNISVMLDEQAGS